MKRTYTLILIICFFAGGAQNLSSGLQACYSLNNDALNNASTGSALNGTLVNVSGTTGHTGISNTAVELSGSVGSYIALPSHPGLKNNSVFFSGWFRFNSFNFLQYLVYTSNGCSSNFEAYSLTVHNAGGYVFCVSKAGSNCYPKPQIISKSKLQTGVWYHVCFYVDDLVTKLYVNGILEASTTHNVKFGYQPGSRVFLGVTNQSSFDHPLDGAVDNVRFYDRELTQQEVTQLFTQDPACANAPPQGKPVSAFSMSQVICNSGYMKFTDQSTNSPTSWSWQFPGANPASSLVKNPIVYFPSIGVYTVSLTAYNGIGSGNTSVQTVTVGECVSLIEHKVNSSQVTIFPNPCSDRLYAKDLGENSLFVMDVLGKTIEYTKNQVAENICEIKLADTAQGIYFVRIVDPHGNQLSIIKLILAK